MRYQTGILTLFTVLMLVACGRKEEPWRVVFEEVLRHELAAIPSDRPVTVATNYYVNYGDARHYRPNLTLVNIGDKSLIQFFRIDAYLAVNVPNSENPVPASQPRENTGEMLLGFGQNPLRPDEKSRWVDIASRNEMTMFQAASTTVPRQIAVDGANGVEIAMRPWPSLSQTTFDIAGANYRGHELIRAMRPGLDIIIFKDTISLRYTRPPAVFRTAHLLLRAYPWILGPRRTQPIRGHAVFMDRREGDFVCPVPGGEMLYCSYKEPDAQ